MDSLISKDLNFIYILKPDYENEVYINFQDLTVSNRNKNVVTEINNGNPGTKI